MDTKDSTITDKIQSIDEFCRETNVSTDLRIKLKNKIEYAT